MNMKLIYTTPEAEVIIIRPTFSVLQGSNLNDHEDPIEDPGSWGDN